MKIRLVVTSALALFLELSLIRWLPAHVFSISFFSNVVLIASFLGLGMGLLLSKSRRDLLLYFPWMLAVFTILILSLQDVQVQLPAQAQTWIWSYYYGNRLGNLTFLKFTLGGLVTVLFVFTALLFVPLGHKIGTLMRAFDPLYGYTLNILGSLLGVVGFALLSWLMAPAFLWFLIVGGMLLFVLHRDRGFFIRCCLVAAVVVSIGLAESGTLWSPYYAIQLRKEDNGNLSVFVNRLFHQRALNFQKEPALYQKYLLPYEWFHPKRVLIIGAGTGNDVWVAQQAGAEHIDAVEIDPVILRLGHPQHPYADPRVRIFIDDARSFMHRTNDTYDMVVYGTLDSHATLSMTSSIRLDNYVYTAEAFEETKRLLAPDGVVVLLFSVPTDWMAERLLQTTGAVFGADETRFVKMDGYLFNLMIVAGPGMSKSQLAQTELLTLPRDLPVIPIPRDDWPYLYLRERGIPTLYFSALFMMICFAFGVIVLLSPIRKHTIDPVFFLLGAGFLLLETKSVTTFSLLFGSTWLINAVVFSAILGIALLANYLVAVKQWKDPRGFLMALLVTLVLAYGTRITGLLNLNTLMRGVAAGGLVALPIFFSSILFAILFKRTKDVGLALGSNLLGAVTGGFIEYTSMIWGLNVLYLIAAAMYLGVLLRGKIVERS